MPKAKLSVIIPVHNRQKLFLECLKSVFKQTIFSEIEVVIIDDYSLPFVENYLNKTKYWKSKQVRLVRNKTLSGPSFSRNQGIKISTGKYLAFLDSDDIWDKNFGLQMLCLLESSSFEIYSCTMTPEFSKGFSLNNFIFYSILSFVRNVCFYVRYIFNKGELNIDYFYMTRLSGMIFKRSAIKNIRFDRAYKSAEDWKFVFECMNKNKSRVGLLPKNLVRFNYNTTSETFGRSDYYKYYSDLLKEIPSKYRNNFGIKMFKIYTEFCIWKNTKINNQK